MILPIHLYWFLSRSMSLTRWREAGFYEREARFVTALAERVRSLTVVSYGGPEDRNQLAGLSGVDLICNDARWPAPLYRLWVQHVLPRRFGSDVVVRSAQISGANLAMAAASRAGRPYLARAGYLQSDFAVAAHGAGSLKHRRALAKERTLFTAAGAVMVTTSAMARSVARYGVPAERVHVVPNYVDTDSFRPAAVRAPGNHLASVGRLHEQKNFMTLLDAIDGLDVKLTIFGEGQLRDSLTKRAERFSRARLHMPGRVPHEMLPARLADAAGIFILPSLYEGHPKALIEAMALGLPVIGAASPGIAEQISDGETGLLADADASSLRRAIQRLVNDRNLAAQLGTAARAEVERTLSLAAVLDAETAVLARFA